MGNLAEGGAEVAYEMEVDRDEIGQRVDKRGAGLTYPSPDFTHWWTTPDYLVNLEHEPAVGCRLELRRGDAVGVIPAWRQLYVAEQHDQFQVVIAGARSLDSQTHGEQALPGAAKSRVRAAEVVVPGLVVQKDQAASDGSHLTALLLQSCDGR
jgi:hypothetical protein